MKKLPVKSKSFQSNEKAFREWLEILGYAPTTVYQMPNSLREFLYYLEQNGISQVSQLNITHFNEYFKQLKTRKNTRRSGGISNSYLNKHLQMLYKFTEYLNHSKRAILPTLNIKWEVNDTEEVQPLTKSEIKELFSATYGFNNGSPLGLLNIRDRAILCIFYGCGLRRSEGYHLDIHDIDFDKQLLHVRKGKACRERFVPFNFTLSSYLNDYVYKVRPSLIKDKHDAAFFISQRGFRMDSSSMGLRLEVLQQRTHNSELKNKRVSLHVLRHSIATHLLQNGMRFEKISKFLGHTSLESTQIYTHLIKHKVDNIKPEKHSSSHE